MAKIFVFIGPSCAGKDTIFKEIIESTDLTPIIPYTTRPMRDGEVEGKEYHFINNHEMYEMINKGEIVEKREYNTTQGLWIYGTSIVDVDFDSINDYAVINTLAGYREMVFKNNSNAHNIVPIYISTTDEIRIDRAVRREKKRENPDYVEMCRRFVADAKDYSEENINKAGIKKENIFENNNDINDTINNILEFIERRRTKNRAK